MREISLWDPFSNGFEGWPLEALDHKQNWEDVKNLNEVGKPIYVKFVMGDRKGSIAKFIPDHRGVRVNVDNHARIWVPNKSGMQSGHRFNFSSYGHYTWDGRRNKVKGSLHSRETVWLPDYMGPTVWEKFDAKAAKAAAIENPDVTDIDGKSLDTGDKVLYINARYGSAMELDHGTIVRFEAKANSLGTEVFVIVANAKGVESKIGSPAAMIWKK